MSNGNNHKKEVYLVRWKQQKNHVEIFDNLEIFAASLQTPVKLTTLRRFKLTMPRRFKLTMLRRSKVTT